MTPVSQSSTAYSILPRGGQVENCISKDDLQAVDDIAVPLKLEEGVYFSEVMNDQNLEALLNKIGNKIVDAVKDQPSGTAAASNPAPAPAPTVKPSLLASWQGVLAFIGGSIGIIVGIGAGLNYLMSNAVSSGIAQTRNDIATITEQNKGIRKDLDRLLDRQSSSVLAAPKLADSQPQEVADAAKRARERDIAVTPVEIYRLSESLRGGIVTPVKWEAITELANLRSFRNATLAEAKQHIVQTVSPGGVVNGRNDGEWAECVGGTVALDGDVNNPNSLFLRPGTVLRVVGYTIFKGAHVIYNGGELSLTNVFFDDCTFEVADTPNGRKFLAQVLNVNPYTTFVTD
jgi:hypothetical protein